MTRVSLGSVGIFVLIATLYPAFQTNVHAQTIPPIPKVISVTPLGTLTQNPVIYGRDGTFNALVNGKSVWTFGDTPMSVPGVLGNFWDDNSLSWTTNLNASQGINLNHDLLDSSGAPAEFLPYLPWESQSTTNTTTTTAPCNRAATYAHPTGFLREDLPLVQVVFGK